MRVRQIFAASTLSDGAEKGSGGDTDAWIDIEDADARSRLRSLYELPARDWVRLNLIASVSGSAAGADSTSESLTNPVDRVVLGVIRSLADVVLVGAASVRAEGYRIPKTAVLAILTVSGNLSGHRIGGPVEAGRVLVLCPASAEARARQSLGDLPADIVLLDAESPREPESLPGGGATVVSRNVSRDVSSGAPSGAPSGALRSTAERIPVAAALEALRARGLRSVVCEGGPSVAAQLLDAGLVDELCLSTSAMLTGGSLPLFAGSTLLERSLELRQLLIDDASNLYARWVPAA